MLCWSLAGGGLSALLLLALTHFLGVRAGALDQAWRQADGALLLLAVLFSSLWYFTVSVIKLQLLLLGLGVDVRFREVLFFRLGEGPLKLVVPFKGAELFSMLFFWRHKQMPVADAAGALAFDKGLNVLATTAFLLLGVALSSSLVAGQRVLLMAGAGAALLVLLLCRPLQDRLAGLAGRLPGGAGRLALGLLRPLRQLPLPRRLGLLALALVHVLRPYVACYLILAAYHQVPALDQLLVYTSLAVFAGLVPGPAMGIGPREAVLAGLFGDQLQGGGPVALSVGLLLTVALYLVPYGAGLPWIPWFLRRLAGLERPAAGPGAPPGGTPPGGAPPGAAPPRAT